MSAPKWGVRSPSTLIQRDEHNLWHDAAVFVSQVTAKRVAALLNVRDAPDAAA